MVKASTTIDTLSGGAPPKAARARRSPRDMLDQIVLVGLGGYRRFISPYKGFRCAYGVVSGRGSCSDVALRITRRFGAGRMLRLSRLQAARCKDAFLALQSAGPRGEEQEE